MLLLVPLLAQTASAAPPTGWGKCTVNSTTVYATSAECHCLRAKSSTSSWWGDASGGAAKHILAKDSPEDIPLNTCFELSAYVTGYDLRTESMLERYGMSIAWDENENLLTGATNGSYHFDTAEPERIVWTEHEHIHDPNSPDLFPFPDPLNPNIWVFQDAYGEAVARSVGNGSPVSHAMAVDVDDNGLIDITVVFDNGEVWNLDNVMDPYDIYQAPEGPPPGPGGPPPPNGP